MFLEHGFCPIWWTWGQGCYGASGTPGSRQNYIAGFCLWCGPLYAHLFYLSLCQFVVSVFLVHTVESKVTGSPWVFHGATLSTWEELNNTFSILIPNPKGRGLAFQHELEVLCGTSGGCCMATWQWLQQSYSCKAEREISFIHSQQIFTMCPTCDLISRYWWWWRRLS